MINKVRKICETMDFNEANRLLDDGWELFTIILKGNRLLYVLTRE